MEFLSPELADVPLQAFMREALAEAQAAGQAGDLPIGAVLVVAGQIVSRGRAQRKVFRNQLRHAELNALLDGGEPLWHNYAQAILITTVEPCPLCLGAAVMADVPHIIFGLHDPGMHGDKTLGANPYVRRHLRSYAGGVLDQESSELFEQYAPRVLAYIRAGGKSGL